jgi:hypothetical protein
MNAVIETKGGDKCCAEEAPSLKEPPSAAAGQVANEKMAFLAAKVLTTCIHKIEKSRTPEIQKK